MSVSFRVDLNGQTVPIRFQTVGLVTSEDVVAANGLLKTNNLSDVGSAATSRTNLGLGTIATQNASAVAITGGSIAGITDLAVADGGTGASTAAAARTNLDAQQADADLTAIAALTSAADTFPYATGAGTWALTGLTAFARSLLATASNSAFLTALGQIAGTFVDFLQAGTGAINETIQAALRRTVYADQFFTPQQAVTAAGSNSTIIFPRNGTTTLTAPVSLNGLTNVVLRGYGHLVQCGATRIASYFDLSGSTNCIVEGFKFDGKQSVMPVYTDADYAANQTTYNTPVVANGVTGSWSNILVRNCSMVGLYTNFVWAYQGTGIAVENCRDLKAPLGNQTLGATLGAQQFGFVYLQTIGGPWRVTGCNFIGTATTNPAIPPNGVFYSGMTGSGYIANNYADYCSHDNTGTHRLGVFDGYGDSVNVVIENNVCTNVMAQFGRMNSMARSKIINNSITYSINAEANYNGISIESTISFSGQKGCQDVEVSGNTLRDPGGRHAYGVGLFAYDWGTPLTNIRVHNNAYTGSQTAVHMAGPFYNVRVSDENLIDGLRMLFVSPVPAGATMTATQGTEANSSYDRLFVRRLSLKNPTNASGADGITISLNTATAARVGLFEIDDNVLEGTANTGVGVVLQGFSTNKANTEMYARRNRIRGYNYAAYFRDNGLIVWEDNRTSNLATATYLEEPGAFLALSKRGNRVGGGILSGTATLVAGTVTVSNTEIQTGDVVILTRRTPGGTVGDLSAPTASIVNATSFVINSASATDTSTVSYQIIH